MQNKSLLSSTLRKTKSRVPFSARVSDNYVPSYRQHIPAYYLSLGNLLDPNCPILKQCVESPLEYQSASILSRRDPLLDDEHSPVPGIVHRYASRALLFASSTCAMYCRYCFRKSHLNVLRRQFFPADLNPALQYLRDTSTIEEVILTGGDPLSLNDRHLAFLLHRLELISHIKVIRIHTRSPATFPMRITPELISIFKKLKRPLVIVTHFNHPKEITTFSLAKCHQLGQCTAYLLNQSVLLKGVNDCASVLARLSWRLMEARVVPYYLHHPDKALGTEHFWVTFDEGKKIYHELMQRLPGYLVPRYVWDEGNNKYKTPLI